MKIGPTGDTKATERSGKARRKAAPETAVETAETSQEPVDSTSILGIPEAELTPHVRHAIMALMSEVESLRKSLKQMSTRLSDMEVLADQDPLLPVYNRRAFVRELTRVQASVARYGTEASLVYIDLNHFKKINDSYGHEAGDYLLAQVARRLQEGVRDTDIVGRLGGDEFGLILSRTRPDDARHLIARLTWLFDERPIIWQGQPLKIGLSSGVVSINGGGSAEQTLSNADDAMYAEKRAIEADEAEPQAR